MDIYVHNIYFGTTTLRNVSLVHNRNYLTQDSTVIICDCYNEYHGNQFAGNDRKSWQGTTCKVWFKSVFYVLQISLFLKNSYDKFLTLRLSWRWHFSKIYWSICILNGPVLVQYSNDHGHFLFAQNSPLEITYILTKLRTVHNVLLN